MKKAFLLFFILFLSFTGFAQSQFQVSELSAFCRFWGFLKYYHPYPSQSNISWDSVLVSSYPKIMDAQNKDDFKRILLSISQKLGELKPTDNLFTPSDTVSKNADFKWMDDTTILSFQVCAYLKRVKKNHIPFRNKYIKAARDLCPNPQITESKGFDDVIENDPYRYLALARYWNIINYYFPYKYLMDTNWGVSLKKAIPLFMGATNSNEYCEAIRYITACTNDGHASWIFTPKEYYKPNYCYPPFTVAYLNGTLVVDFLSNDSLCRIYKVKVGDTIIRINEEEVKDIWTYIYEHNASSNELAAENNYKDYFVQSKNDNILFSFIHNGKIQDKVINNYSYATKILKFNPYQNGVLTPGSSEVFYIGTDSVTHKKYGYINIKLLKVSQVDSIFKKLSDIPYLIIDMRGYPNGTWGALSVKLLPKEMVFEKTYALNYDYPGYMKCTGFDSAGLNSDTCYNGKVIILTNWHTQSQAEYTTMVLQRTPNSVTIGTPTAGADGDVSSVTFPGNYVASFSGLGIYYPDGRETQRVGIIPDIKVIYTLKDILTQNDVIFKRALKYIESNK